MKVLMIEDNDYKCANILESISKLVNKEDVTICKYRNAGLREIREVGGYDLLILDMQFPIYEDSRVEPKLGLDVLHYLMRRRISIPTIICSSEKMDYAEHDDGNVRGYIVYDSSVDMSNQFANIINEIFA